MKLATKESRDVDPRKRDVDSSSKVSQSEPYFQTNRRFSLQILHSGKALSVPPREPASPANVGLSSAIIPTIFHEEWWLDAATNGNFSIVEVMSGGRTVGRLPFTVTNRFGLQGIWTPPLTHFLGPGVDAGEGSMKSSFLRRLDITRELIAKLPKTSWQCIRCHRGTKDVIAFQEGGFKTYTQFSHEIEPCPIDQLWRQMRAKTRNVIRRATEQFMIKEIADPDEFVSLYVQHLSSRRMNNTLDLEAARRLANAVLERRRGRILAARNRHGDAVAVNFCTWDSHTSYYVACARGDNAGNGASSLLLWDAIQHAARNGLIFDLAGIGTRGSILHYAGFGAAVSTRFVAIRASLIAKVAARARLLFAEEHFLF